MNRPESTKHKIVVYAPYIPLYITPQCIIDVPKPLTRWQRIKRWFKRLFVKRKLRKLESFIFPIIKNIPENLHITDLISCQPMNEPSANTFYMDFVKIKPTCWQRFKKWAMDWVSSIWFLLTNKV